MGGDNSSVIPFPTAKNAGYNDKNDGEADWCVNKWCYADPCKCNAHDLAPSSWLHVETTGKPLFYTYATCGSPDTFTKSTCDAFETKEACEALATGQTPPHCMWTER